LVNLNMKLNVSKLLPIVGLIIFIIILTQINIAETYAILSNTIPLFVIFALLFIIPTIAVKGIKWNFLIRLFKAKLSDITAAKFWLIGYHVSSITPGKMGDLIKIHLLKDVTNLSVSKRIITVLFDRIFDIISLSILAIFIGLLFYQQYFYTIFFMYGLIIFLGIIVCLFLFIFNRKIIIKILRVIHRFLIPKNFKEVAKLHFSEFQDAVNYAFNHKKVLFFNFAFSLIAWFMIFISYYLLARAISIKMSFIFMIFFISLTLLLNILPISFEGVGLRDMAFIFFLTTELSLSVELAISFSILILLFNYVSSGIGSFLWIKQSKNRLNYLE